MMRLTQGSWRFPGDTAADHRIREQDKKDLMSQGSYKKEEEEGMSKVPEGGKGWR